MAFDITDTYDLSKEPYTKGPLGWLNSNRTLPGVTIAVWSLTVWISTIYLIIEIPHLFFLPIFLSMAIFLLLEAISIVKGE